MDKIVSFEAINALVSDVRSLRKGYLTNFFLDKKKHSLWMQKGEFFFVSFPGCHFLLHLTKAVNNLFFIAATQEYLSEGLKTLLPAFPQQLVVDIVGNENIAVSLKGLFTEQGFHEYETLYRMSRIGTVEYDEVNDPRIESAQEADVQPILDMLRAYFNPLSEQLPCQEEIMDFISNQSVRVFRNNGEIGGFIIFEIHGLTLYWRYWFILPKYREMKIGSRLFNEMLRAAQDTKRQYFWVIGSNENAIKRYRHWGFKAENLFDYVLVKPAVESTPDK